LGGGNVTQIEPRRKNGGQRKLPAIFYGFNGETRCLTATGHVPG